MDVARLSRAGYPVTGYPATTRNTSGRERVLDLVSEAYTARPVQEPAEKVVQGELLSRHRTAYSSTQEYLGSRLFDAAADRAGDAGNRSPSGPGQSGRAVGAYLSHTPDLIQPDAHRGRQVDYFI